MLRIGISSVTIQLAASNSLSSETSRSSQSDFITSDSNEFRRHTREDILANAPTPATIVANASLNEAMYERTRWFTSKRNPIPVNLEVVARDSLSSETSRYVCHAGVTWSLTDQ